jgi:hypothetical protein
MKKHIFEIALVAAGLLTVSGTQLNAAAPDGSGLELKV